MGSPGRLWRSYRRLAAASDGVGRRATNPWGGLLFSPDPSLSIVDPPIPVPHHAAPLAQAQEGQNLLNLLYNIAEDQARKGRCGWGSSALSTAQSNLSQPLPTSPNLSPIEGHVHRGITCNACNTSPLRGIRYKVGFPLPATHTVEATTLLLTAETLLPVCKLHGL